LARALDHLPGVFYVIGPAGRLIRWNARFESVSGYPADELRGSLAFRFFEGEDRRRIAEAVLRVFAVGDARVEADFITQNGDALPMLFSGSRIVIDGDPHLVGMGIDVADRIAAEEALRRREMEYRMLAENVIDVVSHHTADTTRLYVSPSIEDLVGFTPEELIGRRALEDIHPDDRGEVQRSLQEALEHGPVARAEYRMRCKDGSWVWVETVGRYIDTGLGDREIIATTRDISNQKALEEQLREALAEAESAREEAERAERLKSLFLANMSHEIRTPLTSIIGFSEVLADEVPDPYSGMAKMVGKSGQRLIDTIGSVLALSKLEAGRWTGDFEPVDLGEEVCTTIDLMSPQSTEQGVPIHLDVPEAPIYARVDRSGLQRVIDNLLSNAIKFSPTGCPVQVRVRLAPGRDQVVLEVEDDGPGIPKSQQQELFNPFTHVSSERDSRTGAGLGLSITRRLVDRMDGHIDVDSDEGEGTRFIVTFPQVPSPASSSRAATS
jgi:PAS domain S-box-containing protein